MEHFAQRILLVPSGNLTDQKIQNAQWLVTSGQLTPSSQMRGPDRTFSLPATTLTLCSIQVGRLEPQNEQVARALL